MSETHTSEERLPEIDTVGGALVAKTVSPTYSQKSSSSPTLKDASDITQSLKIDQTEQLLEGADNPDDQKDHNATELSEAAVRKWKVNADNYDESFAILETAIRKLMSSNPDDLVIHASHYVQEAA